MIKNLILITLFSLAISNCKSQSLDLISPAGNENWAVGSEQLIQWSYSNVNFIKIEYSIDGGINFTTIVSSYTANSNSFEWTVPATPGNNCIIRIKDFSSATFSQNQLPFAIDFSAFFNITSPNGGEVLTPGNNFQITWNDTLTGPNVNIEYSGDDGINWLTIVNNYPNTGTYDWIVPNTSSNYCRVKISDSQNNSIKDSSNYLFSIVALPSPIEVLTPNGGEIWYTGFQQAIMWTAMSISSVNIEISYDLGNSWNLIETNYPASSGYYLWDAISNFSTQSALIKISDASDSSVFDISNFPFTITLSPPSINLISPNGGETFSVGLEAIITWNSISVNSVSLEYSINNGLSWNTIQSNLPASSGSYAWTVPNLISNTVLIRVSDFSNNSISDQSVNVFSIIEPTITFINFPIGSVYSVFSNINIYWTSIGLSNQPLELSYSNNSGQTWNLISSNVPNVGQYSWLIDCIPTDSLIFKIGVPSFNAISAISPGAIKVVATTPSIFILTPSSFEIIGSGTTYPITWVSYAINYVRIELSINGDTIFNVITPFAPAINGIYYWNVPANLSATNCKIRISNAANTNISTQTNSIFSILPGTIEVLSGNNPSNIIAGSNHQINWTSSGTSNYVNIFYSTDSLNWNSVLLNYPNTGNYSWNLPYIQGNNLWYKIIDSNDSNIYDINNIGLTYLNLNQFVYFLFPSSGNTFLKNSVLNLNWQASEINTLILEYSSDNGVSWNNIISNYNANIGNYSWTLPNIIISNGYLRIKDQNNNQIQDQISFSTTDYFINLLSPAGGEAWFSNNPNFITWESFGVDFVNILLSIDNGINWDTIETNVYNLNYYNWQPTNLISNNCIIKIIHSNNPFLSDENINTFSLNITNENIQLLNPNGGENLIAGNGYYIDWLANGVNSIDLFYTIDNGLSFIPIANNIPSVPSYYFWQTPNIFSNNVKIKIAKSGVLMPSDISSSNFSIISNVPSINVLTPNGGETLFAGSFKTIKWSSSISSYQKIYFSENNGNTYSLLNTVIGDSSYVWQVPNTTSNNCFIKIIDAQNSVISDSSNNVFSILPNPSTNISINLLPLNSNQFCAGDSILLNFNLSSILNPSNEFRVHLSNNNGSNISITDIGGINSNTSGSVYGVLPNTISNGTNFSISLVSTDPPILSNLIDSVSIINPNANFEINNQLVLLPFDEVVLTPEINQSTVFSSSWQLSNNASYNVYAPTCNFNFPGKFDIIHSIIDTNGCSKVLMLQKAIAVENLFNSESISVPAFNLKDIAFENELYGIAIIDNGNCIITSDSGKTWSLAYTLNNPIQLNSIFIFNNGWYIATGNGNLLKSIDKGNTWNELSFGNNESLNDIKFISQNSAYAIGNNGKLIKYNGSVWQNQNAGTNKKLNKIAINNNSVIVVGNEGTILKKQNNTWLSISSPTNVNINSICLKDSTIGYLACDFGFILKTSDGGNTWNVSLSGADVNFNDIVCNNDTVWAIATDGIIYTSINNGATWNRYSIGELSDLNSIIYQNNKGYIVGNNGLLRTFNKPNFVSVVNNLSNTNLTTDIICFPNPSSDYVTINFNNTNIGQTYIVLCDLHGKIIYESEIKDLNSSGQIMVDLKNYHDGVYFLTVVNNSIYQTFKVVKTK
ncbi:MAG TPA: YCF48-related protein [Bacteroidia bacterium]|nr:YCF48-related protein [Bacteroidia bacterium]